MAFDRKKYDKQYYQKNKQKINTNKKEYHKEWNNKNPEYQKKYRKEWNNKNPEYQKEYRKEWIKNNPEYYNKYKKHYTLKNNPTEKIKHRMRCVIGQCMKRLTNNKKSQKTLAVVGLESWDLFRKYIEKQWVKGMNWDNYGVGKNNTTWHIDHTIPLFLAKTEEDVYKLNHYTNLKPMWGSDNIRKSNK
jgi:hypothetical protein